MSDTLQAIGRSLGADVQTLATVSQNTANTQTPGYRAARSTADFATQTGLRTSTDQRDGGLAQTTRPLDLALRGVGFFAVERADKVLLARSGSFRIDSEGSLVTASGDRVLGSSGPITLPTGKLRVDADGQLWVDDQNVGQLQIVSVADASRLRSAGSGVYEYDGELGNWNGSVVQGALERANVDAADEMLRMMETTRHIDSVRRALTTYDQMMDTGINRLGDN